jgi:hypothetical protein
MQQPTKFSLILLQTQNLVLERCVGAEGLVRREIGPDSEDENQGRVFDALIAARIGIVDPFAERAAHV